MYIFLGKNLKDYNSLMSPKPSLSIAKIPFDVGSQLRQHRRSMKLTLNELSQRASLSVGLLSQIERGITSPSLKSLHLICDALNFPVGWLFDQTSDSNPAERSTVVRQGARRTLSLGAFGLKKELLSPDLGGNLQMYLMTIRPEGHSGPESYAHDGEEGGMVLAGTLKLSVEGQDMMLYEGDAFRFSSGRKHRFSNPGQSETRVIWTNSQPFYSNFDASKAVKPSAKGTSN